MGKKIYFSLTLILILVFQVKLSSYEAGRTGLDLIEPVLVILTLPFSILVIPTTGFIFWLSSKYGAGLSDWERPLLGFSFLLAAYLNSKYVFPTIIKKWKARKQS